MTLNPPAILLEMGAADIRIVGAWGVSRFMSAFFSKICPLVAAAGIFSFTPSAHATIWNIDAVLGGIPNEFGASLFHSATSSSAMSGGTLGAIDNTLAPVGTYNDLTGAFSAVLSVTPNTGSSEFFSMMGAMLFGGVSSEFGNLESPTALTLNFDGSMDGLLPANPASTMLGFSQGNICCTTDGPNTFLDQGSGMAIMTLWGANGFGSPDNDGKYTYDPSLGMDLRLKLSAVPVPAALPLFGTGLGILGFLGWRRRRKAAEAV